MAVSRGGRRSSRDKDPSSGTPDVSEVYTELQKLRFEILRSSIAITRTVAALHEVQQNNATLQLMCVRTAQKGYQSVCNMLEAMPADRANSAALRPELDELNQALQSIGLPSAAGMGPSYLPDLSPRVAEGPALELLTPREVDVLRWIAMGNSTKQTASLLGISCKTAACHRYRLMDKLGIHDTASLVRFAIRQGLVDA